MSVQSLADTIQKLMRQRKSVGTTVKVGQLSGNQVLIDGNFYPAEFATDVDVDDGQSVYVMISEDGSKAVIVGD